MTGHGGGAHVEPILIIGSELLPVVGLHQVHPLWNLHLARPDKVACGELIKSVLKVAESSQKCLLRMLERDDMYSRILPTILSPIIINAN